MKTVKWGHFGLFENPICGQISKKIEGGLFVDMKKFEKVSRGALVSSGFGNARKSFWLREGLEPATAGLPLNWSVEVTSL